MGRRDDRYSLEAVERLLGLQEDAATAGGRDLTVLDLVSWASDPGGDYTWQHLAQQEQMVDAWMARRGPLQPDGALACALWDFQRAMAKLPALTRAVVAWTLAGFTEMEIGELLGISQQRVSRILHGRPKRDSAGQPVRDDDGAVIYVGGAIQRLAYGMNHGGRTR